MNAPDPDRPTTHGSAPPASGQGGPVDAQDSKKPGLFKRKGVQIAAAGLLGLIVGAAAGGGGTAQTTVDTSTAEAATERAEAAEKKLAEAEEALTAAQAAPPTAEAPAPAPEPEPEPEPVADAGMSDGSFEVIEVQVGEDFAGDFEATLRVRNTADDEKSAIMTITLLKGGSVVASLQGSANEVGADETATVQLFSTDPYEEGPYETEFQVDGEF